MDLRKALSFDDVLLEPEYSDIRSRKYVDTSRDLFHGYWLKVPILSSPMASVTNRDMAVAMSEAGGIGVIHRFQSDYERHENLTYSSVLAVGVKEENLRGLLASEKVLSVCVDVAHGDSIYVEETIEEIRSFRKDVNIIAGNVATLSGARRLAKAGADAIRVGIGSGSACTTRIVTGCGVPLLQSILDIAPVKKEYPVRLIADGGIRNSGDIVKSLAAGADFVMLGGLLAGCKESASELVSIKDRWVKEYYGSSSKDALQERKGSRELFAYAPEGEKRYIPYAGKVKDVIDSLMAGVRSGMTYLGVDNLDDLIGGNFGWVQITNNGLIEGMAKK